jgi:hypothetical protein
MFSRLKNGFGRELNMLEGVMLAAANDPRALDYATLAARCRTQNEFNRLHIDLENVLTPAEIAELTQLEEVGPEDDAVNREVKRSGPKPVGGLKRGTLSAWLGRLRNWAPQLFEAPQHYQRRAIADHVTLYHDPACHARDKDLLVAFAGAGRRLLMPIAVFLQFLDSDRWDVVVLKRCPRNSFLLGLGGVSNDFPGLIAYLQAAMSPTQYRRVITLGTCAGGYPALWAALLMNAERGISIGGFPPKPAPSSAQENQPVVYQPSVVPHEVDLRFVYGADYARDHQFAIALSDLFGGQLWPVPDIDKHGVFGVLLRRGQLAPFLEQIFE